MRAIACLLLLADGIAAFSTPSISLSPHARRHPPTKAIDSATLAAVAVYDAEHDAALKEMQMKVDSANANAAQSRNQVDLAQNQLSEMNQLLKTHKTEAAEAKAEVVAVKEQLEAASLEARAAMEQTETATTGATQLATELEQMTRKKEMHHDKARQFYAEAKAAKEQLETATTGAKQLVAELKAATEQAEALKAEVATLKAAAQSSVE